jgi:hypothetical protein
VQAEPIQLDWFADKHLLEYNHGQHPGGNPDGTLQNACFI